MRILDADELSVTDINRILRESVSSGEEITIVNPRARHHLGIGILGELNLRIQGSAGYFCGCLNDRVQIRVEGSAGWYGFDNIMGGEIVVEQDVGSCAAPGMRGGVLAVRGHIGSRPGQVMKGGTIVVGGNSGFMTGFMLIDGNIVVCGDAGDLLGHYMISGNIYVGGNIKSLGMDVKEEQLDAEDDRLLTDLLERYDLKAPAHFRKFVSAKQHYSYQREVNSYV